ncbi:hypothetical protein [Ohtaekwangia koreensis]|uniref:hypothetical protein n=1 Tax=Ohtaekwangia koreensis TaxID=688867 RepID=UPI0013566CAE|nr:hypothetical protein [Ohtaekwangia koreensis]
MIHKLNSGKYIYTPIDRVVRRKKIFSFSRAAREYVQNAYKNNLLALYFTDHSGWNN